MQAQYPELHARVVAFSISEAGRSAAGVPWAGKSRMSLNDRPWLFAVPPFALAVMVLGSYLA